MPAYLVVDVDVTDPVAYESYKRLTPPSLAAYGAKYLARGGAVEVLEGTWQPSRLVILEFENAERAKAWLESPEYAPARAMRHASARTNMIVIAGV